MGSRKEKYGIVYSSMKESGHWKAASFSAKFNLFKKAVH